MKLNQGSILIQVKFIIDFGIVVKFSFGLLNHGKSEENVAGLFN